MSLIKCPECGKVFSDRAAHCPQCGLPTSDALKAIINEQPSVQQTSAETTATPAEQQAQTSKQDYRPQQQKAPNNSMLYILIGVVIVLAIACIALLLTNKFGSATGDTDSADTTAAIPELPADTSEGTEDIKTVQPQVQEEAEPVEQEPEALPEASETEEIQQTPAPSGSPATPKETTPANVPVQ